MTLAVAACKTNAQDAANVAAATASGQASGYASGNAAGTAAAQANAVKAANMMIAIQTSIGSSSEVVSVVKFAQDNANLVVLKDVNGSTTTYLAIDVSTYTTGTTWSAYVATKPTLYVDLTANGNGTFSCNISTCITWTGATSSTMVFEKTTTSSKDLDKAAAIVEAYQVEKMASGIASEFGLSDDRSIQVAKLAASWSKVSKTRALTNADADAFAQQLAGVNFAQINSADQAMMNGSMNEMNAIITKAAEVNGTTSENMSAIMSKLFF